MPDDSGRWDELRGRQHNHELRRESDRRIQKLEDDAERDRGRQPPPRDGYSGNGIQRFLWVLVGGLVSLAVAGLLGAVVMYRQLGQHETWLEGLQRQVDRHEQMEHRRR